MVITAEEKENYELKFGNTSTSMVPKTPEKG